MATRHFIGMRGAGQLGPAAAWVAPVVRRRLAAQIAVSRFVAEHIDGPSHVVYAGVAEAHPPAASSRGPVVLIGQRLEPEKRTELGLQAFARSGLPALGWRLEIAGDGACRASLERLAESVGVLPDGRPAVSFLGHRRDMPALMARASVLLAPCDVDGLGLTVLEAMAGGLPVVAAAAGGHLETVGRVEGAAMFTPGDVTAAADWLAKIGADEAHRTRLAQGQQDVQRRWFTPEAQQRATDAVYRSVL